MINVPFDQIHKATILDLVTNEVPESKTIEYKEQLPDWLKKDQKDDFLADVSSFANASGGHIIYGIKEKRDSKGDSTGIPEAAIGLAGVNTDQEILRMGNMIRDCIDPRIHGFEMQPIDGFEAGPVIVVRILKSWNAPHMVKTSNSRFASRTSAGKYWMDVREIRAAFALSEALPERIKRFRNERLAKIVADETPVPLLQQPKIVFHVFPISALDPAESVDVVRLADHGEKLPAIGYSDRTDLCESRLNIDGFLSLAGNWSEAFGYAQLFRNGALESVNALSLMPQKEGKKIIYIKELEAELIRALGAYLRLLAGFQLDPPTFLFLALLGVKGYRLNIEAPFFERIPEDDPRKRKHFIDRHDLLIPERIVQNYADKPERILKPIFDCLWQACGFPRSLSYDENGNWKRRR